MTSPTAPMSPTPPPGPPPFPAASVGTDGVIAPTASPATPPPPPPPSQESTSPIPLRQLWFGIVAAPLAWSTAELVGYILAGRSCWPLWPDRDIGVDRPVLWVLIIVGVLVLIGFAGLVMAWRNVVAARTVASSRVRFMAHAGVIASGIFLLGTIFFGIPAFIVHACAAAR